MTSTDTRTLIDRVLALTGFSDLRAGANAGPGGTTSPDDVAARMIWSSVVEPGDRVAHQLVASRGAADALRWVHEGERVRDDENGNELSDGIARWTSRLESGNIVAQLEAAVRVGAHVVIPGDELWPSGLHDLGEHAPHALWVRGDPSALERTTRSVAVVGARASTGYGEHVTMELVSGLVRSQFTVVSGAAYGIDGMAHRAALAEEGDTIAILAGGIDRLYPSGHDALLQRIIAVGAVVTEMPPGFSPTKWRFLQRNRLIAAMTRATVVVEAGWRSGSLNTAHHAVQLGRPLGVVPGPVTSASSAGCHRLLREEPATCVTSAEEIAELVDGLDPMGVFSTTDLTDVERRTLDAVSTRARPVDDVMALSGLSRRDVEIALGTLDALGVVEQQDTLWRRRKRENSAIR